MTRRTIRHLRSVIVFAAALIGCGAPAGHRTSPFALFGRDDMRAGLPFHVLDDAAHKESFRQYQCVPLWAKARRCSLPIETGRLIAIVDSTDHVIRLLVATDSTSPSRNDVHGLLIFRDVVRETRASWDSAGTLRRDGIEADTPYLRWLDRTARWGASLWYSHAHRMNAQRSAAAMDAELAMALPDSLGVTDWPAYSLLMERQPMAVAPKSVAETPTVAQASTPTPDELLTILRSDLRALTIAEEGAVHANGNYETRLDRLPVKPSPGVRLELIAATPDGWSAIATHASLPGVSCVVYAGDAKAPPATRKQNRRGAPGEIVCDG